VGAGATWHEDQLVPVTRHGRRDDVWWTIMRQPAGELAYRLHAFEMAVSDSAPSCRGIGNTLPVLPLPPCSVWKFTPKIRFPV
jgi:hypothetical protein